MITLKVSLNQPNFTFSSQGAVSVAFTLVCRDCLNKNFTDPVFYFVSENGLSSVVDVVFGHLDRGPFFRWRIVN